MSIRPYIKECIKDGRLVRWEPLIQGDPQLRQVLLAQELYNELQELENHYQQKYGFARLRADVEHFIFGEYMTVAFDKDEDGLLKRLTPKNREVWTFRMKRPKPSIRLFGRFAYEDVFVAMNLAQRKELGPVGSFEWKNEIHICRQRWTAIFNHHKPLSGEYPHDYIKENVIRANDL